MKNTALRSKLLAITIAASSMIATSAIAAPITLNLVGPITGAAQVSQTAGNPCIFGDSSCNAGALGTYTQFPTGGGSTNYAETQSYLLSTVRAAVGNFWSIGVDVNTTNTAGETLNLFNIYLDNVLLYTYTGGANIATGIANGTGKSDWFLDTINLSGLTGTTLRFDVNVSNATNGREQFFIVDRPEGPPTNVPLPATALLIGLGAVALSRIKRTK